MEAALRHFLEGHFGAAEAARIEARWRAGFGLAEGEAPVPGPRHEEYADLLGLLLEHADRDDAQRRAVARWIAFTCVGLNHLWEDLGLPDRPSLTVLMGECFPGLRERNSGNMRWKKFFYRQLCERSGVSACRSPSCDRCSEYDLCFEPRGPASGFPIEVRCG